MITKKMRKASRFYNCVLKRDYTEISRVNAVERFKQRMWKQRREVNEKRANLKQAPMTALKPPSIMHRREENVHKTSFFKRLFRRSA
jgi:hypothetical protein